MYRVGERDTQGSKDRSRFSGGVSELKDFGLIANYLVLQPWAIWKKKFYDGPKDSSLLVYMSYIIFSPLVWMGPLKMIRVHSNY